MAATAEKQYFDNVYYVHKNHAFLALEPQKIKILQKHFTGIIFSPIEMILNHFQYGLWGGAKLAPSAP